MTSKVLLDTQPQTCKHLPIVSHLTSPGPPTKENAMDAIKNAYTAATRITDFWSAQVGRALNPLEDFSMLVEWSDAIDAGIAAALSVRSWLDLRDLDAMRDECDMWLDHWHTYNQ